MNLQLVRIGKLDILRKKTKKNSCTESSRGKVTRKRERKTEKYLQGTHTICTVQSDEARHTIYLDWAISSPKVGPEVGGANTWADTQ